MNQEERIRLNVEIFGTTYKMVGTFSEKYVKQISGYVNEIMESISKTNPRLDTQKVAVLALFQVADEYFQLQGKWDSVEHERAQLKRHIEELRKAFELSEDKERGTANEVRLLSERIANLEKENMRIAEESELASRTWVDRVEELELKYKEAVSNAETSQSEFESRIRELMEERDRQAEEAARLKELAQPAAELPLEEDMGAISSPSSDHESDADASLLERYKKLQQEYIKLQNEFNEWIELTLSETQ